MSDEESSLKMLHINILKIYKLTSIIKYPYKDIFTKNFLVNFSNRK